MILDEVVYIDQFPLVFTLANGMPVDLDIIGIYSLSIQDSLLIVTTPDNEGMWSFFSLPEHNFMGKYLTKGGGPNEFVNMPWVEKQHIFAESGQIFGIIYDFQTGKSYRMNISETLQNKRLSMSETDYSLPRTLFGFSMIDTTLFLCKEVNNVHTQQIRYVLSDGKENGKEKSSRNLEKLNKASIRQGEDINILSTSTKSNPGGSRIVEVGISLNQINLYSVDDSFGKTICVGKQLDDISKIQNLGRGDRIYTYMSVMSYPKFFGALYLNETERNYQQGMTKNPVIQFFDWDGNPLAEVKSDRMITTYAIDFIHGSLYVFNFNSEEEVYRYDIREILEKIENINH